MTGNQRRSPNQQARTATTRRNNGEEPHATRRQAKRTTPTPTAAAVGHTYTNTFALCTTHTLFAHLPVSPSPSPPVPQPLSLARTQYIRSPAATAADTPSRTHTLTSSKAHCDGQALKTCRVAFVALASDFGANTNAQSGTKEQQKCALRLPLSFNAHLLQVHGTALVERLGVEHQLLSAVRRPTGGAGVWRQRPPREARR